MSPSLTSSIEPCFDQQLLYGIKRKAEDVSYYFLQDASEHHQNKRIKSGQEEMRLIVPREESLMDRTWLTSHESDEEDEEATRKRNLERNRIAAHKCRQRKKEWINQLERRAESLANENKRRQQEIRQLKEEFVYLRNQLFLHKECQSPAIDSYIEMYMLDLIQFPNTHLKMTHPLYHVNNNNETNTLQMSSTHSSVS
ncbi:hypothetical protein RMCBS344292_06051 [Rhizopus microsporus]|nr:hypothetical protein RMCBS344292_06051 [Rhizopus microsporus]